MAFDLEALPRRSPWIWLARLKASQAGDRLVRGAFWSLAGAIISRGLALLASILVARVLGKHEFGQLGMVQSTVGMFSVAAGFGMGLTANKHVAEFRTSDPIRAGRIIGLSSLVAWVMGGLMTLVLLTLAPWLATHTLATPELGGLLQAAAPMLLLGAINGAQNGALAGFEAFRAIARINLLSGLLAFPITLLGAVSWSVEGAVWAIVANLAFNCWLNFGALRAEARRAKINMGYRHCRREWCVLWRFSLPAVLAGALAAPINWIASAMLVNQIGGYEQMGVYNAVLRVKSAPEQFLAVLLAPGLSVLSDSFARGDRGAFKRTLLFTFLCSSAIVVPLCLLQTAAPTLTLLPYGPEYYGHPRIVQWMMAHGCAFGLLFPMGSILISTGRMWLSWSVNLLYAALFMIFASSLIPHYGASGFAAANTIAYIAANLPCLCFLFARLPDVMEHVHWLGTALFCGLLLILCAVAGSITSSPLGAGVGLLASLAFLLLKYRLNTRTLTGKASLRAKEAFAPPAGAGGY